ncbi:MAG: UDP-glucose/GDP-mannose dehydrogenase family protein [Nanoarchaeota archaeon]
MKIACIGCGYVGLVVGTCLADMGNDVICIDIDKNKIDNLEKGILPIYEQGLADLVKRNKNSGRLVFTTDIKQAVEQSEIIFITVGTPAKDDGSVNLSYVSEAAKSIGQNINGYKVIVNKSTVPVGTADEVRTVILSANPKAMFDMVSNPEFLREGKAIKDFMTPDRIIIGVESDKAKDIMVSLYKGIERTGKPMLITNIKSAELIKYASNAMLATRISFMNQLAPLCEKIGADVKIVAKGIGLDSRIGPRFLQAGIGYGGSCFPKDVRALVRTLKQYRCQSDLLESVEEINKRQKYEIINKLKNQYPKLQNKKIAVWGLSFKPDTNDMRGAPSVEIIKEIQKLGAIVRAFDPVAIEESKKVIDKVSYGQNPYDTIEGCDALIILTEWNEFRDLDKEKIKKLLKNPVIIDGRNIYDICEMKKLGFKYLGIGRGV